jgi:transcriptional regulator with XRE-family HTH domain
MPPVPTALPDTEKIRALIWERGYSQAEFARRIGRPARSLYSVINDKPFRPTSIAFIRQIARGLGVKPSVISDWTGDDIESGAETKIPALDTKKGPAA